MTTLPRFDAIVLGGGEGRRLGGVSKPDLVHGGDRLLDRSLAAVAEADQVVAVVPPDVVVPTSVQRALEDPPRGGPVAGVAAGVSALGAGRDPAAIVVVLACDMPGVNAAAVGRLVAALAADEQADGACLAAAPGRPEWLAAAYRTRVLPSSGVHNRSMKSVVRELRLVEVPASADEVHDIDEPSDLGRPGLYDEA